MSSCDCWKTHGKSCVCAKNEEQVNWILCGLFFLLIGFLAYKGCSADNAEKARKAEQPPRVEQARLIKT